MRTIEWNDGVVTTLDQTALPHQEVWIKLRTPEDVASAIRDMKIRGAPLIGVAAALGLALAAYKSRAGNRDEFLNELERSAEILRSTRPTAINLFWAVDRVMRAAVETEGDVECLRHAVIREANKIVDEDVNINLRIGREGSKLIEDGDTILTHCNAGSLATVEYGTALAVIRMAWNDGKKIRVIVDETRPLLQGARLTAYELMRDGIPVTLIADSAAGYFMSKGLVNKIIVGADRIVEDAVINKIGTYSLAILAKENRVPFYVAAPTSSFDLSKRSEHVIIEERSPDEITMIGPYRIAPHGVKVLNPAFDVTPLKYVSAIISENGVLDRRDLANLKRIVKI
ncbi:MAG: S-methyl-5-thioribose-1-phosphate isomerase [Nitrososphaerota archaeon]|nr:S-methyl-5-thioribose-1-phosphate isomerase [Candidatus Bathyarchaeota archaeon]MDW8049030.1 S-methyl-5-thioribose-1-phosphate isomerase [Nitrososphaerota archaeon]